MNKRLTTRITLSFTVLLLSVTQNSVAQVQSNNGSFELPIPFRFHFKPVCPGSGNTTIQIPPGKKCYFCNEGPGDVLIPGGEIIEPGDCFSGKNAGSKPVDDPLSTPPGETQCTLISLLFCEDL